jgi:hypothetical protein
MELLQWLERIVKIKGSCFATVGVQNLSTDRVHISLLFVSLSRSLGRKVTEIMDLSERLFSL